MKEKRDSNNLVVRMDKELVKYLETYLMRILEEGFDSDRDLRMSIKRWRDAYRQYVEEKTSPFIGCSNIVLTDIPSKVTGLHSRIKKVRFSATPLFEVIPQELNDYEKCQAREQYLDYNVMLPFPKDIRANIYSVLKDPVTHDACLCGTGIFYNPFVEEKVLVPKRVILNSTKDFIDVIGADKKGIFSKNWNNLVNQEQMIANGVHSFVRSEVMDVNDELTVKIHYPQYVPREKFIISKGATDVERALIHGRLQNTTWADLVDKWKNGWYERIMNVVKRSTATSGFEEDDVYDYDDPNMLKYWERNDLEVFEGIVMLDLAMIKKASRIGASESEDTVDIDENEENPSPKGYHDGMKKYIVHICTGDGQKGTLLRLEEYPYQHQRSMFYTVYIKRDHTKFDGIGVGQMCESGAEYKKRLFDMYSDAMLLNVMKIFKVPTGSQFNPYAPQFEMRPFAVWQTDDLIEEMKFGGQDLNSVMTMTQMVTRGLDTVTGVQEYMTGRESMADPSAPASKTLALIQEANITIGECIEQHGEGIKPIGYDVIENMFQFGDDNMEYRVLDKKAGALWNKMSKDDLIKKADYRVRGKAEDMNEMVFEQNTFAIYNAMMQNPLILNRMKSIKEVSLNLLKAYKTPNYEVILPTDEELFDEQVKIQIEANRRMLQEEALAQAEQFGRQAQKHIADAQAHSKIVSEVGKKMQEQAQLVQPTSEEIRMQGLQKPQEGV